MTTTLDQRGWTAAQDTRRCVICGRPAILRSPRGKPCHWTCAIAWADEHARPGRDGRFTCTLAPACSSYARVTIADAEGDTARACPQHAVAALNGITGARVIWTDTRGINDHERAALHIAEERSQLAVGPRN